MRAVLDTNLLVSALLSPNGLPAHLVEAWFKGRFILVSHPLQIDELRDVTRRDKIRPHIPPPRAGRLVNQIIGLAEIPRTKHAVMPKINQPLSAEGSKVLEKTILKRLVRMGV